jgi:UDP-2,3-diacylglucosamine pyrophosphatase LpxH
MDALRVIRQNIKQESSENEPTKLRDYKYILISDIHLGSPLLKVDLLIDFLRQLLKKKSLIALIINGDLIDNSNLRWPDKHWQVIDLLDQLQQAGVSIKYIIGNHDRLITRSKNLAELVLSRLFNYLVCNSYTWVYKNQIFFAIHGDNWDPNYYLRNTYSNPVFKVVECIYSYLCTISPRLGRSVPYKINLITARINEVANSVYEKSLEYATVNNSHVFTGHTHQPMLVKCSNFIIGNDGSWTSENPTFIGIIDNHVLLNSYTISGEQTQALCLLNEVQKS